MDNDNYCNNFITFNNSIDNDITERWYTGNKNDDCVTVLGDNESDDDIQSVAQTLKSIGDNTLFWKLPDYSIVDYFNYPLPLFGTSSQNLLSFLKDYLLRYYYLKLKSLWRLELDHF